MKSNVKISDEIITKYLCGEALPEEAISLEDWLGQSPENRSYFDHMEQAFLLVSARENEVADKHKIWNTIVKNTESKSKRWIWMYSAAAAMAICVLSVLTLMYNKENQPITILAKLDTSRQKLVDESIVLLEKGGQITLDKGFGKSNRNITLQGKASFDVVHDEKMPFIISSQGVFIEDLGTQFSVESVPSSDTVYVIVNQGIVRLYDELGSEIIIKAGEKAWYIRSQKKIITSLDTKVLKFDFTDVPLSEVVDILTKTYDIEIKLQPEEISNCHITTQFFDEEIATIITIITETLGFRYEYQDHHYIIKGKPCK